MSLPEPRVIKKKIIDLKKADTNVRIDYPEEGLEILRKSIRSLGLLELPKITPDGEVFAGWGRVEACRAEGIDEIWVVEVADISAREQLIASLAENFARTGLDDSETRVAIKRLNQEHGLGLTEIARVTGMHEGTVNALLSFYNLPEDLTEDELEQAGELKTYTAKRIDQVLETVPEEDKTEVARKLIQTAQQKHPSGKTITQGTLKEIANMSRLGRNVSSELDRIMEEASKEEYMTISLILPESVYMPWFKWSKMEGETLQEKIIFDMKGRVPELNKKIGIKEAKA
jgi:ParB-like chromosome segregation protein Spo0J